MQATFKLVPADFQRLTKLVIQHARTNTPYRSLWFIGQVFVWLPVGAGIAAFIKIYQQSIEIQQGLFFVASMFILALIFGFIYSAAWRRTYMHHAISKNGAFLSTQTIQVDDQAGVGGISFSAGEPFLYFKEMVELVQLCAQHNIYSRVVTNSFWARNAEAADRLVAELKDQGLCQLRLSYSRWHQQNIPREQVLTAARSCERHGLDYFRALLRDRFFPEDDAQEQFLRQQGVRFFPEPMIYAGRAESFPRRKYLHRLSGKLLRHESLSHPGS